MINPSALECRVLLTCLAEKGTAKQVRSDMADAQLSWEKLFDIAARLGVGPLLYFRLGEFGLRDMIPAALVERSKNACLSSQARNMKVYAVLQSVLASLAGEGVPVVVLKGAALAVLVYQHIGLRTMADVDILVDRRDLDKAGAVVEQLGFVPQEGYRNKQWYKDHHHHMVPYVSADGSVTVEIHWHIIERTAPIDLPMEQLWDRAQSVRVATVPCLALSPEHMLLHVILHLSSPNRFLGQLRGLCDVAALLRRFGGEIDWLELQRMGALAGANRHLYVVLSMVRETLGAAVPADVLARMRREIVLFPFEERLIMSIGLSAAMIVDLGEKVSYEWIWLDLVQNLLGRRTRLEACRVVLGRFVQRAKLTCHSKWVKQVRGAEFRI